MDKVRISVRRLVEFILRSGDIDTGQASLQDAQVMWEGSAAHKRLQKEGGASYRPEVQLTLAAMAGEDLEVTLEGRADGIFSENRICLSPQADAGTEEFYTIDEIKGTYRSLHRLEEPETVHRGQALCYAYMLASQEHLSAVGVRVTYVHLRTKKIKRFYEEWTFADLKDWFTDLLDQYAAWIRWAFTWRRTRNASICAMDFPFPYRTGQKRLVAGVYQTLRQGKRLFIQAPTGTGKTMATLFPAIRVLGEDDADKIFYLTAKTITRTVATEAYAILAAQGLQFKHITLTAKEKCCVLQTPSCNPQDCPRAKGHFDRINEAVFALITRESAITAAVIAAYAETYQVCPYELQLDAAVWLDGIICDYNYVFDPYVYLKRFFAENRTDAVFLVDEAHNLVDRARDMYSASMSISQLSVVHGLIRKQTPKLSAQISRCIRFLKEKAKQCPSCSRIGDYGTLSAYLMRMMTEIEPLLKAHPNEADAVKAAAYRPDAKTRQALLQLYLDARSYVNAAEVYDEDRYLAYGMPLAGNDFMIKIYCVDPSGDLKPCLQRAKSVIFFSATLLPVSYYQSMLSDSAASDYAIYAESPFDPQNCLQLTASDVSSRYTRRTQEEYERIADYILRIVRAKNGNYLLFFPSYAFMDHVFEVFTQKELVKAGHALTVCRQESNMSEAERQQFLQAFSADTKTTVLGFCVLGGIFSEGIDLQEDRLIGAVVVGTGLPGLDAQRELLRKFFDRKNGKGFDYAYLYPGMNKVLQAAGRVIRTQNDRGIIALLDDRFTCRQYAQLFPREWQRLQRVTLATVEDAINRFWEEKQ